jgi:excisionase family DNA binding protein
MIDALGRPLVTITEAQARAGVSRRTIYNWLRAGKVEFTRTAGGSVRIVLASLWRDRPVGGVLSGPTP